MKVIEISPMGGEYVKTERAEYIRYSADNWVEGIGESWEQAYTLAPELEQAYQTFKVNQEKENGPSEWFAWVLKNQAALNKGHDPAASTPKPPTSSPDTAAVSASRPK